MKPLLLLFCYLLFISNSFVIGQNSGKCVIDGIADEAYGSAYVLQIKDTDVNTNLLTAAYEGNLAVTSCTGDSYSYFKVSADDTNFVIETTENFADFDKNTDKTTNTVALVTLDCTLTCTGDSTLMIQFQVTDTNNHKPEFSSPSYEFKVPVPLMPRTDISVYGDSIVATDVDFSNQHVTFTIEPDDFSITTIETTTSKDYTAVFSTRNIIQLTESKTYVITATDSGNPTENNTATITITLDEDLSLDTPSFLQTSYSFNYSVVDDAPVLTANDDSITVSTMKPNVLSPSLTGDFSDSFKLTFDASTRTISFALPELLAITEESFLILTLTVSTDNIASTSVIVYLPEATNAPQFSNHYYTGTYDDVNNKVTHDAIKVVSTTTPEVTIVGDYADYFSIEYEKESDSYKISISKSLTTEQVKGLSEITVMIQADKDGYYDVAALVLKLPTHILQFTDVLYKATYKTDNSVSTETPLAFTTDVSDVSFVVDDTYSKNFGISPDSDKNQYTISVLDSLADDVLKTGKEILLHVKASDKYDNVAQTVVAIQLPETVVDAPAFSNIVYVANYESDGDDYNVILDKDIVISNRDQSLVKVTMDLYTENFDISLSKDKWVIKVLKALDEDYLASKQEIVITLTASEESNEATGQAVLVINWTVKEALQFTEAYYKGVYPEDGKGSIELDNAIDFINVENPDNVAVNLSSYGDNFEVKYVTNQWVVNIIEALDETTLAKMSELIIVLSATEDENTNEGYSVLVIQLPSNTDTLKFSAAYYVAKYVSGDTPTIELENSIELLNVNDPTTVDITLDNYADNFEIKYEENKWIIKIKKILEDEILDKNTELVMGLIAKVKGNEVEAETALVLKLPGVAEKTTPTFSEAFYVVDYPKSGSGELEFQTKLSILNVDDQSTVTISLDNHEENFEIIYGTDGWYINIKKALEDSELHKNLEIVTTLTAKESGNKNAGTSVLVIQLPVYSSESSPIFSDAYYIANYVEDDKGIIDFENALDFTNIADATSVKITLDKCSENLEVKYDDSRWYIRVITNLDDSTKKDNNELLIKLSASTPEYNDDGYSVLILKLPSDDDTKALTFSEAYYVAEYPEKGSGSIDFASPLKFLNANDESAVDISLDKYTENFEVVQNSDKWQLNIKSALDKSVLETESELLITMTAKEGNSDSAYSALIVRLPAVDADTGPEFTEAYYLVNYPDSGTGTIDIPISFEGGADPTSIKISLDNYKDNFEVKYDTDRWSINIKQALEDSILHKNPEIVTTLIAKESGKTNTGKSALVIKLPVTSNDSFPIFSDAYYTANYVEDDKGIIEFENSIDFSNIVDSTSVKITLDKYSQNLEVKYDDSRWYIHVIANLDDSTKKDNNELLITLSATSPEYNDEGYSALILKLPSDEDTERLAFSEAYYVAEYPEKGSGSIDFESPLKFSNVNDESAVEITLDKYIENFEVVRNSDKWQLNIKSALDKSVLETESDLLITMAAKEGNSDSAYSALVVRLPTADVQTSVEFTEAYYLVKYPESGTDTIDVPISFDGDVDPTSIKITLDTYSENFEVKYDSDKWYVNIKSRLDEEVVSKNAELVMTLTATDEKSNKGYSALVLELPSTTTDDTIRFDKAYYIGTYPTNDDKIINLDISFSNADPKTVTISLDNYDVNFEITYTANKWVLNINKAIDEDTTKKNKELVMTMTATDSSTGNKGYSALVIELPDVDTEIGPIFSEPYYIADYPEEYTGVINLESPISFKNTKDTKVSIKLSDYTDNFEVILNQEVWVIKVKQNVDESILKKGVDLVITLVATESDMNGEGYSTLIVRLPKNDVEPIFSAALYSAKYVTTGSEATISFVDPIDITNIDEIADISLTLDNYNEYFEIQQDSESKSWTMKVTKQLGDEVLLAKTDLVIPLTATNPKNDLKDRAVIDLLLPHLNSDKAPKFTKTYYTARYSLSGDSPTVTFDAPLEISNKDNMATISIGTDNYINNFNVIYDDATESWQMEVINNLDQALLNAKVDLVMTLTATEENNDEVGQASLVMRLPVVNTNDAPKFTRIYYYGTYTLGDDATVALEDTIAIMNKDLTSTTVTISFDDSYKDNFEIVYGEDKKEWTLNIKSPLSEDDFSKNTDLVLTLTATEKGNNNIGQAALVLHLPIEETKLPPKFSLAHYTASYVIENNKASLTLNEPITVLNKDLSSVDLTLDDYVSNFGIKLGSSKEQWDISVINPLLDDVITSKSELVLTLTAKEADNTNVGESTLIIKLPTDTKNASIEFSEVYYTATYNSEGKGNIAMDDDDTIKLVTDEAIGDVTVTIRSEDYADYFSISLDGDSYVVSVTKPIPSEVLKNQTNLIVTLVATVGDVESVATLIINLPTSQDSTILFSETLYSAVYKLVDGKGSFSVNGAITVETDEEDSSVLPSFSSSTGYESYFQISYANNLVTVTANDLPTDVLRRNAFIPLIMTVRLGSTEVQSSAVLNVEIEYQEDATSIEFSNVLYGGKYEVTSGEPILTITDNIEVVTDETDVEVTITNEYVEYFSVDFSNYEVNITIAKALTSDILSSMAFIPLTLQATVKGTNYSSQAVLNIEIQYDDEDTDSVHFSSVLYSGQYSVDNGAGKLDVTDTINVVTTRPDDIEASISDDSEYKEYFNIAYADKTVTVTLKDDIPTNVLQRNSFIALTLIVGIKETAHTSSAVLNINIVYDQEERSLAFSNLLYAGNYQVVDGKGVLEISSTISLDTEEPDDNISVHISNEYADFFDVTYSEMEVTITLRKALTDTILNSTAVVSVALGAEIIGTSVRSAAVLNIAIIYDDEGDTESIEFGSILYSGQYSVDDDDGDVLDMQETIYVIANTENTIEVSISEEYRDYFAATYDSNVVTVNLTKSLPSEIVKSNSFIALTLTAGIKDTVHTAAAVLNINIKRNDTDDQRLIAFSNVLYNGQYKVSDDGVNFAIGDTIGLETDEPDSNINVIVTNEYADFFHVDHSANKVAISLAKQFTDTILNSTFVVPVTLQAEITGTSARSTAVVNIEIIYDGDGDTQSIEFASVLYSGEYSIGNGTVDFKVQDTINIITNTDNTIEVSVSEEYRGYFDAAYSSNVVTINLLKELPTDIVESNSFIALTLVAGIKDTVHTASAVLNINIKRDDTDNQRSIAFSSVLYNGQYEVTDGNTIFMIKEIIGLDTDEPDSSINVVITNEYADFFNVDYSQNNVTISLAKKLTDTILNSTFVVPLTLQAEITGTSVRSTAVLNIEIIYDSEGDTQSIEFASVLHSGEYSIDNGKGVLKLQDTIDVITNTENTIEVNVPEEYKEYFAATYNSKAVTVELVKNLPDEIVENNSFIALTLVAGIQDTVHTTSAVLNIHIQRDDDDDQRSITFSSVLYNGEYEVTGDTVKFTVTDTIGLNTDEPDSNINVVITNEFANYFTVAHSEKVVTITSKAPLSADTLSTFSVVPLTLQAQITGTSLTASAVVNIDIKYDSDNATDAIEFTSVLYTGEYSVKDDQGTLEIGDKISIITNRADSDIEPTISEGSEYRDYFTLAYSTNVLTVTLKDNLPAEVQNRTFITLTLIVGIKDTAHRSSAVLNIKINSEDDDDQRSIAFTSLLYGGKYMVADGSVELSVDTIKIETDESDNNVDVTITNEYANYFSAKYSQKAATIAVSQPLSSDVLNSLSVIPLTLQAQITNSTIFSSAVLNMDIKYDGDNDTDVLQFTSVLYSGEYSVDDGKGTLKIDDKISVITSRPDSDIVATISNDSPYLEYFSISYAEKVVYVTLAKTLPSEAIKDNSFLALTLTVGIKDTVHVSSAVLNIELENGGSNDDDDDSKTELHHLRITFAVVVAILSVLLLACIAGAVAYYFLRIRSDSYANLEEDRSDRVRFGKNSLSRSPSSNKSSALEERRPTGFVFNPISDDAIDLESSNGTYKGRRKSVAFDDNVEKMQIDSIDDDTDVYSNDKSEVTHV